MRKRLGIGCVLLLFIVVLFQGTSFAQNDVVASFGDKKLTLSDFNAIIGTMEPERQKMLEQNPQLKETFLQQLVQTMVISDLARKEGFDKKPDVKKQLEFFANSVLVNEYLRKEIAQKITAKEEDIKAYYDGHKEEFKAPAMVRAQHILVKVANGASEDDKKEAKEKIEGILKRIKAGEDFGKLAAEFSDDPGSKQKGGDLGFFTRGRMVKPFEDAAFSLKPGEVSGVVESPFGYHIIKVEETKEAGLEPLEKVRDRINQKLVQESVKAKITEFIDKAMKDAKAEVHPEVLKGEKK
jgi:peptidyl-prolyl cis-trans isomerase C